MKLELEPKENFKHIVGKEIQCFQHKQNNLPFASGTFFREAATTLIIVSLTETLTSYCSAIKEQIKIILDCRCTKTKSITSNKWQ